MRGRGFHRAARPAIDSDQAIAGATMFLSGARSVDNLTPDTLAGIYRLSPRRAEYMLTIEKQRRAAREGAR